MDPPGPPPPSSEALISGVRGYLNSIAMVRNVDYEEWPKCSKDFWQALEDPFNEEFAYHCCQGQ